ncbi:MAG: hypothetical protein Sapg2KO_29810 [Saprospiraceae bacterium]
MNKKEKVSKSQKEKLKKKRTPLRRAPQAREEQDTWVWEESEKCPVFRASGLGGDERPFVITGPEARHFMYDRERASREKHGILYQTTIDRRMIPEIYGALENYVDVDRQVNNINPIIRAHLDKWTVTQQLDFQSAARELAFAIGWHSQFGEAVPQGYSAKLVWDFLYHPGVREHGVGYRKLAKSINEGIERAITNQSPDGAFVAYYLQEEIAGRLSREGMVDALIHGLGTTVALMKSFCVLLVELSRTNHTATPTDAAWREALLSDEVAQKKWITEAFNTTPIVPTMTVSLDQSSENRCPYKINDVEIPHDSLIKFSVYGENHNLSFDPERWEDDPLDHHQISATFAGAPFNDEARDEETGLPKVIYCPAKALMQGFALAFLQNIVSSLNWHIQVLPAGLAPPLPLLVAYPLGLRGYATKREVSLAFPVPLSPNTSKSITPGSKVIVVGGGIGGLVAAYELQKRGCKVTVFEAAKEIGVGKCETLEIDGHLYNVGAHIVRLDGPIKNLASQIGVEIEPYLGKHQKFNNTSGKNTPADSLELIASDSQIKAILGRMDDSNKFGFVGLNDLAATIKRWRSQAQPLVDLIHPLFYGAGYGQADEMSAAYLMRFAEASQHSIQSEHQTGTPKGGFGELLRALAKDLDVRCNARVVSVDRTEHNVTIKLADKTQQEADHIFVACNRPNTFLKEDDQETALLNQIRYLPYITGMIKADGLNKDGFCVTDDPKRRSPIASYTYYHRDTNVLTWYGYAKPGQSNNEFLQASLQKLKSMGAHFPDGEEAIYLQRWDYMPHVAPGDFAAGFYDKLEARQGFNRTWFGGGLTGFELTDCITGWTQEFIERVCREDLTEGLHPNIKIEEFNFSEVPLPRDKEDIQGIDNWFEALEATFPTMLHAFSHNAGANGNREMIVSLERDRKAWTFKEMWTAAGEVASLLETSGLKKGDRAVLVYPPDSLHFPMAFYGCLMLGVIAVPVAPPIPLKGDREGIARFNRIVVDSGAIAALTDSKYFALAQIDRPIKTIRNILRGDQSKSNTWPIGLRWVRTDTARKGSAQNRPFPVPDDVAYVQYTSGSTQDPLGVVITHGMLIHNAVISSRDCRVFPLQRGLCWLPWWHDLMLVIGFCVPPILGTTIVYFSAMKWISQPEFWFKSCATEKISNSAAPNFALELMVKRADMSSLVGVDLSNLVIYTGAELCRPATHSKFVNQFGPLGFRSWNLRNIMGMAECTLYLSGGRNGDSRYTSFDQSALRDGDRVIEVWPEHPNAKTIIACGPPVSTRNKTSSIITDLNTAEVLPAGIVGELWITGPSVATRHIRPTIDSTNKFAAHTKIPESDTSFLRTGDLAFVHDNMVYVCGRVKELIIVGGRNIIPMDIEDAVINAHPAIRAGCVVAFGVEEQGSEAICVVAEIRERVYKKRGSKAVLDEVIASITQAVSLTVDARCRFIGLAAQGSLPKTTSGKLRRVEIRKKFIDQSLSLIRPIAEFSKDPQHIKKLKSRPSKIKDTEEDKSKQGDPIDPGMAATMIIDSLIEVANLNAEEISIEDSFVDFGIDSIEAVQVMLELSERSGQKFTPTDLFNFPNIKSLAAAMSARALTRAMVNKPYVILNDYRNSSDQLLDSAKTIFCMPPGGGHVFAYIHLAEHMKSKTMVAFENQSVKQKIPMDVLAKKFTKMIRELQPNGPWHLLGYSLGGVFGALVAQELGQCNLILVDGLAPNKSQYTGTVINKMSFETTATAGRRLAVQSGQLVVEDDLAADEVEAQIAWDLYSASKVKTSKLKAVHRDEETESINGIYVVQLRAPTPEDGMQGTLLEMLQDDPLLGWGGMCDELQNKVITGGHFSVVGPQNAANTALEILKVLKDSPY